MSQQELTQAIIECNGDAVKIAALLATARLESSRTEGGLKISAKGAVSLYGLGRFPVTLYGSQWIALADKMPEVIRFIEQNRDKLAVKPAKPETTAQVQ